MEKCRIFLHPKQRQIVEKQYSGPVCVLGGAGTGKTVVAMHRAKYLASMLSGTQRLLVTTIAEKALLYVAMTRAQRGVYLTSYDTPSEFLALLDLEGQ